MKRFKYILVGILGISLLLNSCSDKFFDINVDPNNPSEATPALVLPSATAGTAYVLGGYYQSLGAYWTQQYAQSAAASQWAEWESYNLTEDDLNRQFTTLYAGALKDYEYVRTASSASSNWSYYAIATLMQAYTYQVLADLYDKVPFKEALKGTEFIQPHYDDGTIIYDSLLSRIDYAMSKDFTVSSSQNPGTSDLIFGGNMDNWKKFANTLKLKIYLRYVNVDANKYKTKIQQLLTENNFLTIDASFKAFKDEQTGANPFYNTFMDRLAGNVIANKTLMDILTDNNDPRKQKLFNASVTGSTYNSLFAGESITSAGTTIKNYATPNITSTTPVYFFSKEEVLFLRAEAQARYGTASEAEALFNSGISTSISSLGASGTVPYVYNGIKSIMEQKWIAATNKTSLEAFFDYNRTGYPDFFTKSKTSVLNGTDRPKRLFFPASERKSNVNTPAKVALTVKVWWGK